MAMKKNWFKRATAFLLAFCICATGLCVDTRKVSAKDEIPFFSGCFWQSSSLMKAEAGKTYEFLVQVSQSMKLATQLAVFDPVKVEIKVYEGKTAAPAALTDRATIDTYGWLYDMNMNIQQSQYVTKGWVSEYSLVQITFASDAEYNVAFKEEFSEETHTEIIYGGVSTASFQGEAKNTSTDTQTPSTPNNARLESSKLTVTVGDTTVIRVLDTTEPVTYTVPDASKGKIEVDENGVVTAKAAGTFSIRIMAGSKLLICYVTVEEATMNRKYTAPKSSSDTGVFVTSAYYDMMPDTKGDLIIRCQVRNKKSVTGITNLKITFKDSAGKKIVSYTQKSKGIFGFDPKFMIRIKKSKLSIKDADLSSAKVSCSAKVKTEK